MIKKIILILTVMAIMSPCAAYCTTDSKAIKTGVSEVNLLNDLQRGEWLNKEYISKLKATKSPQKAVENIVEDSLSIKKNQKGYSISVIYNFHEGGEPFTVIGIKEITGKKGIYELLVDVPAYITEKKSRFTLIKSKGPDEIQWSYENNHKIIKNFFVRVEPSVAVFVNRILLAGEYKDENGGSFVFSESGTATWPEKKFRYEVNLDYVMGTDLCDSFFVTDERGKLMPPPLFYGFAWNNERLFIYREDNNCNKAKPLYILKQNANK